MITSETGDSTEVIKIKAICVLTIMNAVFMNKLILSYIETTTGNQFIIPYSKYIKIMFYHLTILHCILVRTYIAIILCCLHVRKLDHVPACTQ